VFSDRACEAAGKANISTHGVLTRSYDREGRFWQTQDIRKFSVQRSQAGNDFRTTNYCSKYRNSVNRVEQVLEIKSSIFYLRKQQGTCEVIF